MGDTGKRTKFAIETEAISDLVERMRQLRRKVVLPFVIAAVIVGHLGIAAHVFGYWSIFGIIHDHRYPVNFLTISAAFFLPSGPMIGLGIATYIRMRARIRQQWQEIHRAQGLATEWLNSTTDRFV
jgi:hypothetical protein